MSRLNTVSSAPPAETANHPQSLRQFWPALTGLSAVFLFEMLDNSILTIALPTIGRELHSSSTALQWVTSAYAVMFGGLMLAFGAFADRFGRRRVMLIGLGLLGAASLGTAFVTTITQLIVIRALMGVAAAMTTPGSTALAFRLFRDDSLRIRAITLISTVGLIGLAIGPTVGGFLLAFAPWQTLLLINVPIAALASIGIQAGISADTDADLHREPIDVLGALLGTAAVILTIAAPTLFIERGIHAWQPWAVTGGTVAAGALFILRERSARSPLLDLKLVSRPLVSSGLAFKAAAALATSGMGYLITLQLQLQWGWSPALASIGMLPQVIVLLLGSAFVNRFARRVGPEHADWISSTAVVLGLVIYGALNRCGYIWIALALALVAAGLRVVGVVAATNVLRGLPEDRTTIGAALTDTVTEVTGGIGVAIAGSIIAVLFTGTISTPHWSPTQIAEFQTGATVAGLTLAGLAGAAVTWGISRSRHPSNRPDYGADPSESLA